MDAFAGKGVEVNGHGGGKGLTFTGSHLSDVAAVKDEGTDNLDLEWFLLDGSPRAFSRNSESLVFDVLKGFAVLQSLFEFGGFGTELVIS